jgi:DNA-binding transcriptional regulator YdaS (Cro superfamily)
MANETTFPNLQKLLRQERGTIARIAEAFGITHGAVAQWRKIPPERVLEVERITGISRHALRPDIYGEAPRRKRRAA